VRFFIAFPRVHRCLSGLPNRSYGKKAIVAVKTAAQRAQPGFCRGGTKVAGCRPAESWRDFDRPYGAWALFLSPTPDSAFAALRLHPGLFSAAPTALGVGLPACNAFPWNNQGQVAQDK